jgi:hypothetical protein
LAWLLQRESSALVSRRAAVTSKRWSRRCARTAPLAQHLTMIEQLTEYVAQLKTHREERIREFWKPEVDRLKVLLNSDLKQLHHDLSHRLDH